MVEEVVVVVVCVFAWKLVYVQQLGEREANLFCDVVSASVRTIARKLPVVLGDAALARLGTALWSEVESSAWCNITVPSSWGRLPRSMQIYCLREQEYDGRF